MSIKSSLMKYTFLGIFLLFSKINVAQHPVIIGSSKNHISYAKHNGYAILFNGQKLDGIFEYAEMEFPDYNLKWYSEQGKLQKHIKMKEIKKLVLEGSDSSLLIFDSTTFLHINNKHFLYRRLTNMPVEIYDKLFIVNESQGKVADDLVIILKNEIFETHSLAALIDLLTKKGFANFTVGQNTIQQLIAKLNCRSNIKAIDN